VLKNRAISFSAKKDKALFLKLQGVMVRNRKKVNGGQ